MKERMVFPDRKSFRQWLQQNCQQKDGVWLVFGKQSKVKTLTTDEALEEALCFGWIDGQLSRVDEATYLKYFAPRRKGSPWSERNKGIVEKLIKVKRMTKWGLLVIERAKQDGTWETRQRVVIGEEQMEAFAKAISVNAKALENFRKLSPSVQKQFVGFYHDAKKEETRVRRLIRIIGLLEANKRLM